MSILSDRWPVTSSSALSPSMNSGFRAGSRNSGPKGSAESEAFVISGCYEMGDPLTPSEVEGNREGGGLSASGGLHPFVTP